MTRPRPPRWQPAPAEARLPDGARIDLLALAREVATRYRAEFPDEEERYGDGGLEWCVHDNQHILNWAVLAQNGYVELDRELDWLARVLAARGYPLERLARDLELAGDVVRERVGPAGAPIAEDLSSHARTISPHEVE